MSGDIQKPFHRALKIVSNALKISEKEILGGASDDRCARARKLIAKHLRNDYGYSYPKIGMLLGKHHTTIMHYVKRMD